MLVLVFVFAVCAAKGQSDTTDKRIQPWLEFIFGLRTPGGGVGAAFGVELGRFVVPSLAAGFGGAEGTNWSIGNEALVFRGQRKAVRAFGYWSHAEGSTNTDDPQHPVHVGSSESFKLGAAFLIRVIEADIVIRGGYSWYLREPSGDTAPKEGPMVGLGVRLAL